LLYLIKPAPHSHMCLPTGTHFRRRRNPIKSKDLI